MVSGYRLPADPISDHTGADLNLPLIAFSYLIRRLTVSYVVCLHDSSFRSHPILAPYTLLLDLPHTSPGRRQCAQALHLQQPSLHIPLLCRKIWVIARGNFLPFSLRSMCVHDIISSTKSVLDPLRSTFLCLWHIVLQPVGSSMNHFPQ